MEEIEKLIDELGYSLDVEQKRTEEIKSKLLSLFRSLQSDRDAALKKLGWAEEIVIGIGGFEKMDNTIPGRQARKYLDSKSQALKDVNPGNGR